MLILNYSHPLTPDQLAQLEALTGQPIAEVRDIPTQVDVSAPLAPQATALAEAAQLSAAAWQTAPLLLVPPALNFVAVALIAELHGRMGYFPPVVRLRPMTGALPPRYEIAEIINLQALRDAARKTR